VTAKYACGECGSPIRSLDEKAEPMDVQPGSWSEYDAAAEWCAERGLGGGPGTKLPDTFSAVVLAEIAEHPDEFQERVRGFAYARAMEGVHPADPPEPHAAAPQRCGKYGCTRRVGHSEDCCAPGMLCGACKAEEAREGKR